MPRASSLSSPEPSASPGARPSRGPRRRPPGAVRTAWRTLRVHRLRFAMPALAVVLGVAFVTGSLIYSHSAGVAAAEAAVNSQPDASVGIQPDPQAAAGHTGGPAVLDDALLRRLRALPGAAAARGTAEGPAFLVGSDGRLVGDLSHSTGVDYTAGASGRDPRYPLVSGHAPRTPREIAVDRHSAATAGLRTGDAARVVVGGTVRSVRLTGILDPHVSRLRAGGTLTAFDTATAQKLFAQAPGTYTALSLTAAQGTGESRLAREARKILPHGLTALPASAATEDFAAQDNQKLTTLLLGFAGIALFVSTFLIANTFTMLSAARAREHALLRALGATRRHVLRQVLTEAALVGAAAAVVGYALGTGVAALLNHSFAVTGDQHTTLQLLAPTPLLTALAVGLGVTTLAAYVPARRAAAVSPMAAMRTGEPPDATSLRRRDRAGVAVTLLGALLAVAALDSQNLLFAAAPVLLLGLIILTPRLALGVTGMLRSPLTRWAGVRGTLAVENARRNPRRTAATATTLMVGLAMVTAVTVVLSSVNRMDEREAAQSMTSDLRISAVDFAEVGSDVAGRVAHVAGVADVSPVTHADLRLPGGEALPVTAVDPAAVRHLVPLATRKGSLAQLARGIAVSEKTAARNGWKPGATITGTFAGTRTRTKLPVVAVYDGPSAFTPALIPTTALPPTTGGPDRPRVESVLLNAGHGHLPALKEKIRAALDNPVLLVQDRADARAAAGAAMAPFLNVMYAMLSVSVLIGALGVVNTMGMAVSERVREIGLLRALGLDRRRLASVLRLESVTIALLGAALGLAAGGVLGAVAVLGQQGVPLTVPWDRVLLCFAVTAAIGVLASVWPGRQAARIPLLEAIGTDTE